mmetsp:Transcript_12897/g.21014  ORF Transcript_12897/g.21014 Transcript_12897/m.21014 type:complete len:216 (+) Transcript_12897:481-1128(+)
MRCIVVDAPRWSSRVAVITLFNRDTCTECAAAVGVADQVGVERAWIVEKTVVDDWASVTGPCGEERLVLTKAQTAELDPCEVDRVLVVVRVAASCSIGVPLEAEFRVGAQGAEFGFRSSRCTDRNASACAVGFVTGHGSAFEDLASTEVVTDVAVDAQAGFGARDVEVTGAECIANADVFNGLRLGSDDCVGSASAGNSDESRCGAEEKALDVHV